MNQLVNLISRRTFDFTALSGPGEVVVPMVKQIDVVQAATCDLVIRVHSFTITSSGNVGIGTASPQAALDVESTTSGFLPPRLTIAQRDAIDGGSPPTGSVIYSIEAQELQYYNGTQWTSPGGGVKVGDKICRQHVPGVYIDTRAVPDSWTVTECAAVAAPHWYTMGCFTETGINWGPENGGPPTPNICLMSHMTS